MKLGLAPTINTTLLGEVSLMFKVSVMGAGCVGSAMIECLKSRKMKLGQDLFVYDKYKEIGEIDECLNSDIAFLCLPTRYNDDLRKYEKDEIHKVCEFLSRRNYGGLTVIRSTVEPETTEEMSSIYRNLDMAHNPEFLSAATALEDFESQTHVVLGKASACAEDKFKNLVGFYEELRPGARISTCSATESESMKIFCNSFYAVKVQFFTEMYLLCKQNNSNYSRITEMMLENGWINPMHTKVPGHDGLVSYGGACFPKDTNALNQYMIRKGSPNGVLDAAIHERNLMRD